MDKAFNTGSNFDKCTVISHNNYFTFHLITNFQVSIKSIPCPESTIAKFIENKGAGIHHIAFAIEDGVANALSEAEAAGIRLIDKAPRKGAEGLSIAFLHPKSTLGVLTELCEK